MSYLFSFGLEAYFSAHSKQPSPKRWTRLAEHVARRLDRITGFLNDRELVFEAGESEDLSLKLRKFILKEGSPEEFSAIWDEFCTWADQGIVVSGREKQLAATCHLPNIYLY